MAFHVRDHETDAAVRRLAKRKKKTLTETIREACEHEYEREFGGDEFTAAVRQAQQEYAALGPRTGFVADKAFYDELSGEDALTGLP